MLRDIKLKSIARQFILLAVAVFLINYAKTQVVTADFSFDQSCEEITFQNLSTSSGGLNITGYLWEFGDGNTSLLFEPMHTYGSVGDFNVTLTVFHDGPGQVISSQPVSVWFPVANFVATAVCLGELTEFTSTSTTPPNSALTSWEWDFNNDGIFDDFGENVSFTYLTTGPQIVVLRVTNDLGCQNELSKSIVVKESPDADFSADPVCFGTATQFVNNSSTPTGTLTDFRWDFDNDGSFDALDFEPVYTFPASGIFPVTLEVENNQGCISSITKDVEVYEIPVASYSVVPGCPLDPSSFIDESLPGSGSINFWEWDFDDGSPLVNEQNPSHTYLNNGFYDVQLFIEDDNGCQDDTIQTIIQQKPDAGFQVDDVCLGFPSNFDDTSAYETGFPVDSWHWDFDDGSTSTDEDPVYTYSNHGTFNVELIVSNALLCSDTAYKTILVDTLPIASFSYDPACEDLPTCFYDESLANADTIISWEWNFGDGNISTLKDPCHIYFVGGNYDVTLIVVNSDGCVSEPNTETVFVSIAPDVNFAFNQICFGDTTYFENLTDTFGFQISYLQWDFDDPESGNGISNEFNPSHLFSSPGAYNVKLVVENEYGCIDSIINIVNVDSIPEANFIMPDTISVGVLFDITDLSIPHGSAIFTWFWDFGDGTTGTNISPITHTYFETGNYIVCLTVTGFNGCDNQFCDTIRVVHRPQADFSYASDTTLETFFTDQSQPSNSIISWFWNFGDPESTLDTISGTPQPMWQYPAEGWYSVFLEVEDSYGGVHDTTKLIYSGNAVIADFNQYGQCVGDTTFFIDNSYSPLSASFGLWYWDYGDGTDTSYIEQVDTLLHYYEFPGNYIVRFAVSDTINGFFMTDTLIKVVSVFESPVAKIDTVGLDVCFGTTIQFQDVTPAILDPVVQWIWDFDTFQGDSAFIQDPEFLYADTGIFNVTMKIFTEKGCENQDTVQAHVNFSPGFGFIIENNCVNSPTYFIPDYDSSKITITEWHWDFGDNLSSSNTSTLPSPTHVYERVKEYTITMKMEAFSCPGETQQTTLVFPIPYSEFTLQENFGEVQGRTKFTNNSIFATSYLWDFGNGNTSSVANPTEVYEFDSTYLITLISYNEYFCTDTSTAELTVFFRGLYFPTAFSPNNPNEEINLFTPKGVNLKDYLVQVFDMRGNLMWESDKVDENGTPVESWDGYYEGRLMPQGMYIWKAAGKFKDGSVWQGQSFDKSNPQTNGVVTLLR